MEKFTFLAARIEDIVFGKESKYPTDATIDDLAFWYAELIIKNKLITARIAPIPEASVKEYTEEVDISIL